MDFSQHFSFEKFKHLHTLCVDKNGSGSPNPEFHKQLPIFNLAMTNFIKELSQEKGLMPIKYSEGHTTYMQQRWNKLLNKDEMGESQEEILGSIFRMRLIQAFPRKNITEEKLLSGYNELVKSVNKGDFDFSELSDTEPCSICGQPLQFEFKDWHPSFIAYNEVLKDFLPPKSCIENKIVELEVTFQTGQLLIADWFSIKEFTEQVNYNPDYKKVSINYSAGREASTKFALENFNVITIHVGNNSPSILQKGDNFIFGRDDEEIKLKYNNIGRVCTDLWNVTIVERQQLVNIIANKTGLENAKKIVEEYLKENDYNEVNITPGTYKLRFHPDYQKFKKMEVDKTIPKAIEPYFSLKKVVLENVKKMKM